MTTFEVEVDGKVVKTFEADDYALRDNAFVFFVDGDTVGSIITKPGMSVTKVAHGKSQVQRQYGQ